MESAVSLNNITVSYNGRAAVSWLTAEIPRGQVTAVVGPNGSGKSTLLKAVLGLLPLQSGTVRVLGLPFYRVRDRVAYVPQKEEVDWHFPLLVWEVVAMGRCLPGSLLRPLSFRDRFLVKRSMQYFGIECLARRPIGELSGGQKQRVFLARAMAREAELYLLDEPFNGVDAATEGIIKRWMRELKENEKTVIVVHHKLNEIYSDFDRAMLLNCRLISYGPVQQALSSDTVQKTYSESMPPVFT